MRVEFDLSTMSWDWRHCSHSLLGVILDPLIRETNVQISTPSPHRPFFLRRV